MTDKNDSPKGPEYPKRNAAQNTDRELWREREGDYYADSIHVTETGSIGINCGGYVIVKPVREWHELARRLLAADAKLSTCMEEIVALSAEVASLRNKLNEPVGEIKRYCIDVSWGGYSSSEAAAIESNDGKWVKYEDHLQAMSTLRAIEQSSDMRARVTEGLVLVPVEPTEEMLKAGRPLNNDFGIRYAEACWHGMVAAAPKPE